MQLYQFERIYSQMEKEFGKVKKGEEEDFAMSLFPLEGNVLTIHRAFPKSNSRRLKEAIGLVLFDLKGKYTGEKIDTDNFRNEDNEKLEKALLMAFDPFTNNEVMDLLTQEGSMDISNKDELKEYYKCPIMCLLRINDSIDFWEKNAGANGYFEFIETFMGSNITDDEMHYSIMTNNLFDI